MNHDVRASGSSGKLPYRKRGGSQALTALACLTLLLIEAGTNCFSLRVAAADQPTDRVLILVADFDPPENVLTTSLFHQLRKAMPNDPRIQLERLGKAISEDMGSA